MSNPCEGPDQRVDVVILGGGLAGLCLALQLRQQHPSLAITVLERNRFPMPEAVHKIGESTVEVGAHYFAEVLGLRPHLLERQIKKFGFRFFFSDGQRELDQVSEIAVSRELPTPSYQIDRGIFENYLADTVRERGITLIEGASVRGLAVAGTSSLPAGREQHEVTWTQDGQAHRMQARWLVDASGRAGLLKRQLGLSSPNEHQANAVWFRVRGLVRVDDWVASPEWHARCTPPRERWRSTNHLVGRGYWVWMIPLSSGHHSIGIVADARLHPIETMSRFDKAMDWLQVHQPRLFEALDGKRDDVVDFAYFRNFSYGCKQLFSADRWALTGDAGLFLDPFYSPGSDFIAIANTLITSLITRDLAGDRLGAHAHVYNQIFQSFYESTLALYQDQYGIFGDAEVLPHKVTWDYTYYWGVLAQFFFQGRLTDLTSYSHLRAELAHCRALNLAVQDLLRRWSERGGHADPAVMHDQAAVYWFAGLNNALSSRVDAEGFRRRIRESCWRLTKLADDLADKAVQRHPELDIRAVRDLTAAMPSGALQPESAGAIFEPV